MAWQTSVFSCGSTAAWRCAFRREDLDFAQREQLLRWRTVASLSDAADTHYSRTNKASVRKQHADSTRGPRREEDLREEDLLQCCSRPGLALKRLPSTSAFPALLG